MLTNLDILSIRSHVDDLDPKPDDPKRPWLFSRDCLEVVVALPGGRPLTLLINHLKSKFVDPHKAKTLAQKKAQRKKDDAHRQRQAERHRDRSGAVSWRRLPERAVRGRWRHE